jgi:hypothetical protein
VGHPHRDAMAPCESGNAADMIAMFVGNNDRIELIHLHTEPRQSPIRFRNAKSAVKHHCRASRPDYRGVTTAAAAETSEAQSGHRNYCSASLFTAHMLGKKRESERTNMASGLRQGAIRSEVRLRTAEQGPRVRGCDPVAGAFALGKSRACAHLRGRIPKGAPAPRSGAYTSQGFVTKYEVNSRHLRSP